MNRPIVWGIAIGIVGGLAWLVFVIFSVLTLGKFRMPANIAGIVAAASLPVAAVLELILWIKKRA